MIFLEKSPVTGDNIYQEKLREEENRPGYQEIQKLLSSLTLFTGEELMGKDFKGVLNQRKREYKSQSENSKDHFYFRFPPEPLTFNSDGDLSPHIIWEKKFNIDHKGDVLVPLNRSSIKS